MRRMTLLLAVLALMLGILGAPTASATPLMDVEIVVTTYFGSDGTFTADGLDGCESGTTADPVTMMTGWQSGNHLNFYVRKVFTCDGGTDAFTLLIQARTRDLVTDWGTWTVLSGTGAYENLHGAGTLLGIYIADTGGNVVGITDNITGGVHFE